MSFGMVMPSPQMRRDLDCRRRVLVGVITVASRLAARLRPVQLRILMTRLAEGSHPVDPELAERLYREVAAVSLRCAGWRGCLPRSIAVATLCRLSGGWPIWCVGVRSTPPFAAHAWVEAGGQLVGEAGEPGDYRALIAVGTPATGNRPR